MLCVWLVCIVGEASDVNLALRVHPRPHGKYFELWKKLLVNPWSNFQHQLFQPYMTWIFRHWQHGSIWSSTSKRTSYITVQRKVSKSVAHCKSILQNTQQLQDLSNLNRVRSIWRFTCVDRVSQQLHPEWPQLLTIISRLFLTEVF